MGKDDVRRAGRARGQLITHAVSRVIQLCVMAEVSIRDLRQHGGEVVDRATRGEQITITRAGKAVAELRAITSRGLTAEALLSRWRGSPSVDPVEFREDVDRLLDSSL
jgi:antitoxin (DNA-binding transcriptional repressor) of toxin-antitoxin stability system